MMKKSLITLSAVACLSTASFANADLSAQIEAMKAQIAALEAKLDKTADHVKKVDKLATTAKIAAAKDNLKFDVDFRTSIDNIRYKTVGGSVYRNEDLLTNRLWLNGAYAPEDNVSFRTTLSYMKAYGDTSNHAQANTTPGYANFDWVTNENALGNELKVKEAYWLYQNDTFLGTDVHWTASVGRRPSTDGLGISTRESDPAKSPLSHTVNVEFDGASFKFDLDKVTPMTGSWIKLCLGRGLTNAKPRFDGAGLDYAADATYHNNVDMFGFIAVPYDDGQYSVHMNWARANNLIGFDQTDINTYNTAYGTYLTTPNSANYNAMVFASPKFKDVGNMDLLTLMVKANGIGDGISDFLDDTVVFASWAQSKTDPNSLGMLGTTESKTGHSEWIGIDMPAGEGRWGIEWNQGSEYWRSVTYGEDTMVGSKIAARGTAWEVYYNKPITKSLTASFRYTDIDYDYAGSNSFFGDDGNPSISFAQSIGKDPVAEARDIRAYVRYNF